MSKTQSEQSPERVSGDQGAENAERRDCGLLTSMRRAVDDTGRTVLRATVDFYDGNAPALTFRTVWDRIPVTIIEVSK